MVVMNVKLVSVIKEKCRADMFMTIFVLIFWFRFSFEFFSYFSFRIFIHMPGYWDYKYYIYLEAFFPIQHEWLLLVCMTKMYAYNFALSDDWMTPCDCQLNNNSFFSLCGFYFCFIAWRQYECFYIWWANELLLWC